MASARQFRLRLVIIGLLICASRALADNTTQAVATQENAPPSPDEIKEKLINLLPPAVSDGLEINLWGWFSYLRDSQPEYKNIWDAEVSLDITKSFGQRVAISAEGNFIDANGTARPELEQGYVSGLLCEQSGTLLTVGKFNANFGVEARDFWNRTTGTTSLLFGAQPQDLIGVMVTQPVGESAVTLRPFLSADFQGGYDFNQPPSGGLTVEYKPQKEFDFAVTNWVGPGLVPWGGSPLHSPYPQNGYGGGASSLIGNWQGPNIDGARGGTLYFLEAKAVWQIQPDLSLGAEYVLGTTGTGTGERTRYGWWGGLILLNYDVTDRLHVYGDWSYLDDSDWLITGTFQRCNEFSAGAGYQIAKNLEFRAEYRHDLSNVTNNTDSVSVHLSFGI